MMMGNSEEVDPLVMRIILVAFGKFCFWPWLMRVAQTSGHDLGLVPAEFQTPAATPANSSLPLVAGSMVFRPSRSDSFCFHSVFDQQGFRYPPQNAGNWTR